MRTRIETLPFSGTRHALEVTYLRIDQIKPDPRNARAHSKKQIRQIAKSIESFGFNVPILVDADFNVCAGHGRLLGCRHLGWAEVPTIRLDHLNEAQRRAFMIGALSNSNDGSPYWLVVAALPLRWFGLRLRPAKLMSLTEAEKHTWLRMAIY